MTITELIASNVRYLAREKGIKLGIVEKQCGVSIGYFSRKALNDASIPIHVVKQAAEVLDISLDELCSNFRFERLKREAEDLGYMLIPREVCVEVKEGEPDDIASTLQQ